MNGQIHQYRIKIKEHHLDTFGHVNNAMVVALCEEARWELISENGYGLMDIQKTKQGPVILEVTVKYLRELLLRRDYVIETSLLNYQRKVGQIQQVIKTDTGEVAVEAVFTCGLLDLKERRLIEPTQAWKKAIGLDE